MLANRKFILLGIVLGALIILASVLTIYAVHRSGAKAEPVATETSAPERVAGDEQLPTPDMTVEEMETAFLVYVKTNAPTLVSADDDDLVESGRLICKSFDQGKDFANLFTTALHSGLTFEEATVLIGTSVGAFCPNHADKLE